MFHYGHFEHLNKAKSFCDKLIVSITSKKKVKDSKIFFNDEIRIKRLKKMRIADYVVVVPFSFAKEVIKECKPNIYFKGLEYKNFKNHQNIKILEDINFAKKYKCKVKFIGDQILSSSKIINKNFRENIAEKNNSLIPSRFSFEEISKIFLKLKKLNVLIVGDLIIDKYTYVSAKGLASKNNIISSIYHNTENYIGGAGACYFHLKDFVKNCKLVTLVNTKDKKNYKRKFKNSAIFSDNNFQTIVKEKFVEKVDEKTQLKKFFSTTKINYNFNNNKLIAKIAKYLHRECKKYDLVLCLNFDHNFLDEKIIKTLEKNAKFLSVNCQTNSLNYGFNSIIEKFSKVNSFTIDKTELKVASKKRTVTENDLMIIKKKLKAKYAWFTVGREFTIGIDKKNKIYKIGVIDNDVIDTVGAGDAFFSISSLLAFIKCDLKISTFLSQICGSIHSGVISNKSYLTRNKIINFIKSFYH